ncbi:ABC transporter ATP-binding protein [Treponema pedis]|uniref:ABC transporter ATP-binding protein n=1 Tax=Treponema pedis TaxID=409322 RepID=UPI00197E5DD5|nr:ABC transporter ATP-binding protein [Treponema pedis]QSI04628.1 ABC transporter ATP-binding protein [Treponema pedis]
MKEIIRKFTMGHPYEMTVPVVWYFLEGVTMSFPAIAIYFAINVLIIRFKNPTAIFDDGFWSIALWLAGFFLLQFIISFITFLKTFLPAAKNSAAHKKEFIQKIKTLPLGFFSKTKTGELINTFTGDFLAIEQSMAALVTALFGVIFSCLVTSVFMFYFNAKMAAAFYITIPVAAFITYTSLKILAKLTVQARAAKDEAADSLHEYILGMKILRSYNQTGSGFKKLKNAYANLMNVCIKGESIGGALLGFSSTMVRAGLPLMCFTGAYLVLGGTVSLAEFLSIIIIGTKIISPLLMWVRYITILRVHYESATRIDTIMREKPLTGEKTLNLTDDIVFDKVSFSYSKREKTLENVSCTFKKNTLTAIVGPSGGGKSTMLRLIARFWDTDGGEIKIGGITLKDIQAEQWIKHISFVLQDVYLFNETIRENIVFGNEKATEEDMIEAAKQACCHDFIMKLPEGYDTTVGEGGCTLSGGEKQRISIARALLKNAPILLLDEPTASLDARNEVALQKALSNLVKNKTVIMIAHRLKTVKNADNIIVLDKGKIAEQGRHSELLERKGLYARLWHLQHKTKELKLSTGRKKNTQ